MCFFFLFDRQKEQNLIAFNFSDVEWYVIQISQQVLAKRKKNSQSVSVFKGYLNYIALEFECNFKLQFHREGEIIYLAL